MRSCRDVRRGEGFRRMLSILLAAGLAAGASAAPTPEEVFARPPAAAHAGVWWHWMGSQVTREGIVRDLDWFVRMGITSATVFGMADSCTPWAKRIANVPTGGIRPFSDAWWDLLKFACAEGRRRGIDIGLHNCPGYTSTGGKWIPPALAMRKLVFNVKDPVRDISTKPDALFPVYNEDLKRFEVPACEARRTDYRRLGNVRGVEIGHIPMGAFVQPADWDSFGLECDKMNPEAVAFHLDRVIGELKRHLGNDLPAAGLRHVLLDSYEAGTPSWTPRMREEFKARRGYDCFDYLPILGGFTNGWSAAECATFRADFDRTVKDLYRDVLFRIMSERLRAEGVAFSCEPYWGPFEPAEVSPSIDRIMVEFWYNPFTPGNVNKSIRAMNTTRRADGSRHNVVEAEAFTAQTAASGWTETPASLKPCGDGAWLHGVNRFILHTCPLQPWDDSVRPGVTMGRWGTHFGRTQTWAESGRAWFDYVARAQALLQWGDLSAKRLDVPFAQIAREADGTTVHFLVNQTAEAKALALTGVGRWLDPVRGTVGAPPKTLDAWESGFWLMRPGLDRVADAAPSQGKAVAVSDWTPALGDWTSDADSAVRYFSGTRTYRAAFELAAADASRAAELSLGTVLGATARVIVNGTDCATAWTAPWRVGVPAGVLRSGRNEVAVELTNVWANRLIGDEQEPADVEFAEAPFKTGEMMLAYPAWFKDGLAARPSKGRRCFTTWKHYDRNAKLVPSGLVGPVRVSLR